MRWLRAVLRAAAGRASPWTPETARALLTPPVPADSRAMGWQALSREWAGPGRRILVHGGSNSLRGARRQVSGAHPSHPGSGPAPRS